MRPDKPFRGTFLHIAHCIISALIWTAGVLRILLILYKGTRSKVSARTSPTDIQKFYLNQKKRVWWKTTLVRTEQKPRGLYTTL